MTTTIEQAEPALSTPAQAVQFTARRKDLRLVKVPIYPRYGAGGIKIGEERGETIPFIDGAFTCPTSGTVTLADGREADAAGVLEFLKTHRLNGNLFEGFTEVAQAAPVPSAEDINAIVQAAERLDAERLEELIATEESGWARDAILTVARASLERVKALQAEVAAQQAEADAAAAKGAQE